MVSARAAGAVAKNLAGVAWLTITTRPTGDKSALPVWARPAHLRALARVVAATTSQITTAKCSPTPAMPNCQDSPMAYPTRRQWSHAVRARRRAKAVAWWLDAAAQLERAVEASNFDLLPGQAPAYAVAPDGVDAALMVIVQLARRNGLTADDLGAWLTNYKEHLRNGETENG